MITNKDIRVENGSLIINGDPYPLDGQSPEAIMEIVEDNSDTTPTENSDAPITSGGVFTALGTKQDTLTFDTEPTASSSNPVTSGGLYNAIATKAVVNVETHSVTSSGGYTQIPFDANVDVEKRIVLSIDFKRGTTYYNAGVLNTSFQMSNTAIVLQNTSALSFGGSSDFDFRVTWLSLD